MSVAVGFLSLDAVGLLMCSCQRTVAAVVGMAISDLFQRQKLTREMRCDLFVAVVAQSTHARA